MSVVSIPVCQSGGVGSNPICCSKYCDVAQLVEHLTLTQKVVGSKPAITTMESKPGRLREPPAKRVGPLGLCFEYTALRKKIGE